MSKENSFDRNKYNIIWIGIILLIPLMELLIGVDMADVGFSMNQYRFCMADIDSIYLPLLFTDLIGWALLKLFSICSIPAYLGMELAWVGSCYYLCFLSWRLYRRYRNDSMILPALALAMLLAKTNFNFFIYNTSVALMALTGLYFLVRGMNDKRPRLLAIASFFFVLASLCKISALLQFGVFVVLFVELYRTRNAAYFWKQLLHVILGFALGLGFAAVILHATCGIGTYINMVIEMFFYAGNSTDGHTIGNMVMINIKGALRGALFLLVLAVLYFLLKKCGKYWRTILTVVVAVAAVFAIGKVAGADALPGLGRLYGVVFNFYNALAVLVALIYICMIAVLRNPGYPDAYKMLVLAAGILTVIMPIGSNVGITHICNEFFFALPYILIGIKDAVAEERRNRTEAEKARPWLLLTALSAVWIVSLCAYQSLNKTRAYGEKLADMAAYQIDELRGMKADRYTVEQLEELMEFLEAYEGEDASLIEVGSVPLVNYLTGMRPFIAACGGWIETDYVTAAEIGEQLQAAGSSEGDMPVIVLRRAALESATEKTSVVMDYIAGNSYKEAFVNEEYAVYISEME